MFKKYSSIFVNFFIFFVFVRFYTVLHCSAQNENTKHIEKIFQVPKTQNSFRTVSMPDVLDDKIAYLKSLEICYF